MLKNVRKIVQKLISITLVLLVLSLNMIPSNNINKLTKQVDEKTKAYEENKTLEEDTNIEELLWKSGTYDHDTQTITNGKITLKVGDYINYYHTLDSKYNTYSAPNTYTGTSYEQKIDINDYKYGWRVLGVDDEGRILLVSEDMVVNDLSLGTGNSLYLNDFNPGYLACFHGGGFWRNKYNKVVNSYASVFGTGEGAVGGRSINAQDINKITGYDPEKGQYGKETIYEYGNTVRYTLKYTEPKIYQILYSGSNGVNGIRSLPADKFLFLPVRTDNYYNGGGNTIRESGKYATLPSTYYSYNPTLFNIDESNTSGLDENSIAYKLLFTHSQTGSKADTDLSEKTTAYNYWLSDHCIDTREGIAYYAIRNVSSGVISKANLFDSQNNQHGRYKWSKSCCNIISRYNTYKLRNY